MSFRPAMAIALSTIASSIAMTLPVQPAAATTRDYRYCASQLQQLGISAQETADACSATLKPRDLTKCVVNIARNTEIAAFDALIGCRQSRRPIELGTCIVDISTNTGSEFPQNILDNCRRSLLPLKYSECVVGLSLQTYLPSNQVMNNCLDGRDRPRDFYPLLSTPQPVAPPRRTPGAPPPLPPVPGTPQP
ncbi:MAG: hypothetical protein GDA56_32365 [Hormoscilla sp. GM7CHS1pb]|nr:hypothetical protein [Hormoscilla sp. GM7CHS1pb]